jgi:hypothetical protein
LDLKMNNNLKRILNKISGIDQSTFQISNYCDCVYVGINKIRKNFLSEDLETLRDEKVVRQITSECLKTSNYSAPETVDSLAFAKLKCPNLDYMLRLAQCRIRCIERGYRTNPDHNECIRGCLVHPLPYHA